MRLMVSYLAPSPRASVARNVAISRADALWRAEVAAATLCPGVASGEIPHSAGDNNRSGV